MQQAAFRTVIACSHIARENRANSCQTIKLYALRPKCSSKCTDSHQTTGTEQRTAVFSTGKNNWFQQWTVALPGHLFFFATTASSSERKYFSSTSSSFGKKNITRFFSSMGKELQMGRRVILYKPTHIPFCPTSACRPLQR